jgi:UDP-N-acetylenolpyruvoylglucosamine reductase
MNPCRPAPPLCLWSTTLVRIGSDADVRRVLAHPELGRMPKFVLGGGSNVILTRDMPELVLKVEVPGRRLVAETDDAWIVEAGAGENWHDAGGLDAGAGPGPAWRTWR